MAASTTPDADLLEELGRLHAACGVPHALQWLWSDHFTPELAQRYAPGSDEDRKVTLICAYFEAVGALHAHGLLDEGRLFAWLQPALVWDRLRSYVLGQRKYAGGAALWAHFEALATAHKRQMRAYST